MPLGCFFWPQPYTFYRQVNLLNGMSTLQVSKLLLQSCKQLCRKIYPFSRQNSDLIKGCTTPKQYHFITELQRDTKESPSSGYWLKNITKMFDSSYIPRLTLAALFPPPPPCTRDYHNSCWENALTFSVFKTLHFLSTRIFIQISF